MDALFFHPRVVHLPIALAVLMPLIAAGLWLAWWRGWLPGRAWLIAIALQALLVGSGIVAMRTGEVDEDRVEQVVGEPPIEAHEDAATAFVAASGVVLGLMLVAGALRGRKRGLPVAAFAVIGTLVALLFGYRTGEAGGRLVYQHGAASAYSTVPAPVRAGAGERGDDD